MKAMEMENWITRLYCKMENGPWHLPISHKMHSQACLPLIRNSGYTQAWAQAILNGGHTSKGAYLNWRSTSRFMLVCQGSALPPFLAGSPLEKRKTSLLFLYELVSTASMTTAIAPIERLKLLMQNQNAMTRSGHLSHPYRGIFNCFARTISNDGFISLWRGNTARVIGRCSHTSHWLLGALGLAAVLLVAHPLTYAELRLSNDVRSKDGKWQFNGIVNVWRQTLKSDGIVGLYRGFKIALYRKAMLVFVSDRLYGALHSGELLQLLGLKKTSFSILMVYLGINVCTNVALYPMDTVSKRMMMTSGEDIKYKNTSDAFSQIFKNEGLESFYNGAGANALAVAAGRVLNLFVPSLKDVSKKIGLSDGGEAASSYIEWMEGKGEEV